MPEQCTLVTTAGELVEAHDVDIVAADARGLPERPAGYGVEVVPGVFTLWNRQADPAASITADPTALLAGRADAGSPACCLIEKALCPSAGSPSGRSVQPLQELPHVGATPAGPHELDPLR